MHSLPDLAVLAWALTASAESGQELDAELRWQLRATQSELKALIDEAASAGIVEYGASGLRLTEAGMLFSNEVGEGLKELGPRQRPRFESYLGYVPSRWYP